MNSGPDAKPTRPRSAIIAIYDKTCLGARYVHASVRAAGYPCDLILFRDRRVLGTPPTDEEYRLLRDLLARLKPAVVGVSLRSFAFGIAERVTRAAREAGVPLVVWGGTHPTLDPESCLGPADAAVVGEGEQTMVDIMAAVTAGLPLTGIRNVWTRGPDGIIRAPLRPLEQDLDSVPFPVMGDEGKYTIDKGRLHEGDIYLGKTDQPRSYYIIASRGCPFNCDFCCNNAIRRRFEGLGTYVRKRSPENVVRELEAARAAMPLNYVSFMDELFTLDRDWNREICALYKPRIGLPFWAGVHPRTVTDEMMATMVDAGLHLVMMGIQSGSERSRRENFHRSTTNEEILRATRLIHKYRLVSYFDFIVDNPYETRDDLRQTLELILELPRPHNLEVFSLCWFPSTSLTERALADGKITRDDLEDRTSKTFDHFLSDPTRPSNADNQFAITIAWFEQLKVNWPDLTVKFWQNEFDGSRHLLPQGLLRFFVSRDFFWERPELTRRLLNLVVRPMRYTIHSLRYARAGVRMVQAGKSRELIGKLRQRLN